MRTTRASSILFRVDANQAVGMGHLMRCLSVADEAARMGVDCTFACNDKDALDIVNARGHRATALECDYRCLGPELPRLEDMVSGMDCVIVVDSYFADNKFLDCIRKIAPSAYFDDFAETPRPTDLLINYNVFATAGEYESIYKNAMLPRLVLGPLYAPLRSQFQGLTTYRERNAKSGVLVCVGGSDPERIALRFARALACNPSLRHGRHFTFMLGALEPDLLELQRMAANCNWFDLREQVDDVAGLMCGFEAAISASGTTLYELCACGLPTVAYCLSPDQDRPSRAFSEKGAMVNGGDLRVAGSEYAALVKLGSLLENPEQMANLSDTACRVVDGHGAERLANELINLRELRSKK